jgi:hypothetical protein
MTEQPYSPSYLVESPCGRLLAAVALVVLAGGRRVLLRPAGRRREAGDGPHWGVVRRRVRGRVPRDPPTYRAPAAAGGRLRRVAVTFTLLVALPSIRGKEVNERVVTGTPASGVRGGGDQAAPGGAAPSGNVQLASGSFGARSSRPGYGRRRRAAERRTKAHPDRLRDRHRPGPAGVRLDGRSRSGRGNSAISSTSAASRATRATSSTRFPRTSTWGATRTS